jgi:hypothetical protein
MYSANMSTKGMPLQSFTVTEKLKIIQVEKIRNHTAGRKC